MFWREMPATAPSALDSSCTLSAIGVRSQWFQSLKAWLVDGRSFNPPAHSRRRRTSGHGPSSSDCDKETTRAVMALSRATLVPGHSGSRSTFSAMLSPGSSTLAANSTAAPRSVNRLLLGSQDEDTSMVAVAARDALLQEIPDLAFLAKTGDQVA